MDTPAAGRGTTGGSTSAPRLRPGDDARILLGARPNLRSRRQCLAFIATTGAAVVAGRRLSAAGTGQGLADRCGLQDAPWLNRRIADDFEHFRPGWATLRASYLARCDTLRGAMIARQQQGFTCPIADQILAETRWLAAATTEQARIHARLADFVEAFDRQKDSYDLPPLEQAEDGSWAPYVSEPFHKLDISIDYINRIVGSADPILRRCDGRDAMPVLKRPLNFLHRWADADAMIEELRDCRRSAICRTGRWNRQKYASLLSSLSQLMLKPPIERWLREEARDNTFTAGHKEKLLAFLDEAQDPCTGCWRDGYRFFDGSTHDAFDLSNLYHVVQYRKTGIKRWAAIADGLIAVRRFQYPQGPLSPLHQADDHNDYDVTRVALHCLDDAQPRISADQAIRLQSYLRDIARGAVERLRRYFRSAGSYSSAASTVEADYYKVRLLDLVGFWDGRSRFLSADETLDRHKMAEAMLQRLTAYDDPSPMPVYAIALLRSYVGRC